MTTPEGIPLSMRFKKMRVRYQVSEPISSSYHGYTVDNFILNSAYDFFQTAAAATQPWGYDYLCAAPNVGLYNRALVLGGKLTIDWVFVGNGAALPVHEPIYVGFMITDTSTTPPDITSALEYPIGNKNQVLSQEPLRAVNKPLVVKWDTMHYLTGDNAVSLVSHLYNANPTSNLYGHYYVGSAVGAGAYTYTLITNFTAELDVVFYDPNIISLSWPITTDHQDEFEDVKSVTSNTKLTNSITKVTRRLK
jgi:hypothetical protein